MIRLSIRRPVAVSMAYLAVALLGVAAWRNIPVELLPDTRLPRLEVSAVWPGASPETMEAFVTSPIEAAIQQVRGVQNVNSLSREEQGAGRAEISVEFARGVDMNFVRLELSERLGALDEVLPPLARYSVQPYVPREFEDQNRPTLSYTVTGPYTLEALRAHVDDGIVPDLLLVDGVGNVQAHGGRRRVLEIELDEGRALALGLGLDLVRQKVAELEFVRQAGAVRDRGLLRAVAIRERPESPADILDVPLLIDAGRVVRVQDVARVHDTFEDASSYYRINGMPAVSFDVYREIGTNTIAVADAVRERVDAMVGTHPPGVRLILDRDESEAIRAQLTDLRFRALIAAGVIFVVLLLFLRSFRSAGIVFATIGFSILITLNLIYFGGLTLNVLTLMGMAMGFGLIVDNAIVVLENIYRRRGRGEPAREAAEHGAREVVLPILAAMLTTIVVFIPFVYLQGDLRVYYVPLAFVVGFALVASLFVAFSFIPGLAAKLLRAGTGPAAAAAPASATRPPVYIRAYAAMVGGTLRFPWLTVPLALAVLGGSYHVFDKNVTRGTIWTSWWGDRTYIDIHVRFPRGEELDRTDELTRYFEARLTSIPEVDRFVTRVFPIAARIQVTFPDSLEHTAVPVYIKDQLYAYSHQFGGADVRVYGFGPSFYGGGASPPNYSLQVKGYNYETVREIAEDLGARLSRLNRVREVDTNASSRIFQRDRASELVLEIDRRRLAMHDLSARDVVTQVAGAVRGETRGQTIRFGGEQVGFAVKLDGHRDMDDFALTELLVPTPGGATVRLGDVARLYERRVLGQIRRENQQYERTVAYEFRGPVRLGDLYRDLIVDNTELPAGYTIVKRQEWRWGEDEQRQIYTVLAISLILIFMATAALFESVRQPFCVLLAVPMALVGVFLIFWFTGANFTREAYIGVIMMGGIVVNNAILLVDHVNQLRRAGGLALRDAVLHGTLERVRPILMTSATTVFGLLPLVLYSDTVNSNIWNALGYALIGGLTSSTLFILTVTPALYLLFERGPERRRLARAAREAAPSPAV